MNEPTQTPTHDGCGHPCPASTFWVKEKKRMQCSWNYFSQPCVKALNQALRKLTPALQSRAQLKENVFWARYVLRVLTLARTCGHSVTAEQRMCCVFWVQPICMCIRLSAQLLPDLLGPLLPCYHTNLSAHLLLLLPLSPLLSLSLPLIRALTASWWMAPRWWGDSSCNCSVSPSLTGGVWGVLFFARGSSPQRCEYWPFHPIKEWGPTILNFIHILINVMWRKWTQWALFYMICGHSEKLSEGSQPVCRQTFLAPLHKLFLNYIHLWIKISFLLKFLFQAPAQSRYSDKKNPHITCWKDASQKEEMVCALAVTKRMWWNSIPHSYRCFATVSANMFFFFCLQVIWSFHI